MQSEVSSSEDMSSSSSSMSSSANDASDIAGVERLDDVNGVDSCPWFKQGSKVHLVRCQDDTGRQVPWCRDKAFVQDPKETGEDLQGFGKTRQVHFCQRCLKRVPRGMYVAVAAQCGWRVNPKTILEGTGNGTGNDQKPKRRRTEG